MKIKWNINKKRGNFRPVLEYSIELENFECELAVEQVATQSTIPCPPGSWSASCLPGKSERAGEECGVHRIYTPDYKTARAEGRLILPWRESGDYPEVEESFLKLRDEFEHKLKAAYDSLPIDNGGVLELSVETRRHLAAGLVSKRFLEAAGF